MDDVKGRLEGAKLVQELKARLNWSGDETEGKRKNGRHKREGGFTLVELMVVVAVIAVLAGIAMPQFMSAADKAKGAKEKTDIQTITNAAQLYMIDKGTDQAPTVESLYKEGYLSEMVKPNKGDAYTIAYEEKDGSTVKKVVVKSPEEA